MTVVSLRIVRLNKQRARELTNRIRQAADDLWALLLEAHEGRAWAALGYPTWEAYVRTEFDMSKRHANRLVGQGEVIRAIQGEVGPDGPTVAIQEATARDIKPHLEIVKDAIRQAVADVPEERVADIVAEVVEEERARIVQGRQGRAVGAGPGPTRATRRIVGQWTPEEQELLAELRDGRTVVANLRRHGDLIAWANANGLYERIDRNTRWGNPFVLPDDGDRDTVVAAYRDFYLPHKPSLLSSLSDLKGKLLGCWCAPEACHGDVLAGLAEKP